MMLLKLLVTLRDVMALNREETKESDSIQNAGDGQLDGFMTTLQAIFAESADYTKKSVESRLVLGEKLLGAKSFDTVIQIQTEYAPISSRRRLKWANSIPTSPRHGTLWRTRARWAEDGISSHFIPRSRAGDDGFGARRWRFRAWLRRRRRIIA